jgi:hypothetical protein
VSKSEGIGRIAKVIRGTGWLIIGCGVVGLATSVNGTGGTPEKLGFIMAVTAILSAPFFAVAWIVDGFAK